MTGYIYAISCNGRVKIGYSKSPKRRLVKVASDAPYPCELVACWRGTPADEQAVHDRFVDLRAYGEWFLMDQHLDSFLGEKGIDLPTVKAMAQSAAFRQWLDSGRGRLVSIAKAEEVSPPAVCQWAGTRIPADRVLRISQLTGLPVDALRPDMMQEPQGTAA